MKKRLEALEKIERLQKQMHDLAVWRLNALGRERDELADNHREMWQAMGRGVAAYGPPAAAAMRRIRSVGKGDRRRRGRGRGADATGHRPGRAGQTRRSRPRKRRRALSRAKAAQGARRSHRKLAAQSEVKLGVRLAEEARRSSTPPRGSMPLDPPSDVVLEVLKAADPTRAAAATQRLNALAAAGAGADGGLRRDARADRAAGLARPGAGRRPGERPIAIRRRGVRGERQGGEGASRFRSRAARRFRQGDAAEGRLVRVRPRPLRRHVEIHARRSGGAANRQVRFAGNRQTPVPGASAVGQRIAGASEPISTPWTRATPRK